MFIAPRPRRNLDSDELLPNLRAQGRLALNTASQLESGGIQSESAKFRKDFMTRTVLQKA